MRARQHRCGDRRAKRAGLARARDLHRAPRDVGVDLHQQRIFLGDAARAHDLVDTHAVLLDALDDRARPECGRLDQGAVDVGPRRVEVLSEDEAGTASGRREWFDCRCSSRGPADRPARDCCFAASAVSLSCSGVAAARTTSTHHLKDVADRRLAGLDAEEAGQDRAFDDAADAGDVGDRSVGRETTAQSQVEVPITLTSVPSRTPHPIAP